MSYLISTALLTCCALAALMAPAAVSYGGDKAPVIIGAFYNVTGGMGSIDGPGMEGAKLAAKIANARGGVLGGRKVEIMAFDTKTDLKLASSSAATASRAAMTAAVGYGDSDFVLAAAPHFQARGIPFVTSGATDPTLPGRIGSRLFLAAFGDDDQASAVAEYGYQRLKARRIVLWTDSSTDFTRTLSRFFKERFLLLGGKIIEESSFKSGDGKFKDLASRLKNLHPKADGLFAASLPGDAGAIIRDVRETGLNLPILSGDGFDTELAVSIPGRKLANQVFFSTHMYRGDRSRRTQDFIEAYRSEYNKEPESAFAALGFDAMGLVIDAIGRADSTETRLVAEALANTYGYEGVTGAISYARRPGIPAKEVSILEIKNGVYELADVWKPLYRSTSLP